MKDEFVPYAQRNWAELCAKELFDELELKDGFRVDRKRLTRLLQLVRDQYGVDPEYCTMRKMQSALYTLIRSNHPAVQEVTSTYGKAFIGIGYRGDIIKEEKIKYEVEKAEAEEQERFAAYRENAMQKAKERGENSWVTKYQKELDAQRAKGKEIESEESEESNEYEYGKYIEEDVDANVNEPIENTTKEELTPRKKVQWGKK